MNLDRLIRTIPGWEKCSPQQLISVLKEETIPFENHDDFTWKGTADVFIPELGKRFGREGNKLLQDVLLHEGETWLVNQLAVGIPLTDSEIQATLYYLDSTGLVPGAKHIARAVKRNISLLEHYNLAIPTLNEIETLLAQMKLTDDKNKRESEALDRLQVYREKLTLWPGFPEPPPEL